MNAVDPKGWGDKFLSFCVAIFVGTIALYCAVAVLQAIWGWIVAAIGIAALVWLGVVVYRATKNRWQ